MNPKETLNDLIQLHKAYATTMRVPITAERLRYVEGEVDIEDKAVREPLIEHVGHLPMIASFLYPRLSSTEKIDLGRVLTMLSIHDIGETEVGDVLTFEKTGDDQQRENAVANKILGDELLEYFTEMEARNTTDAKFAKSVDALAPFLHEISHPDITRRKLEKYGFGSEDMREEKEQYFQWDSKLSELFTEVMSSIERIECGENPGYKFE